MFDQLVQAIRERHQMGRTEDEIHQEVLAQGHSNETFTQAYAAAVSEGGVSASPMPQTPASGGLLNIGDFLSESFALPFRYARILGEAAAVIIALLVGFALVMGGIIWATVGETDSYLIAQALMVGVLIFTLLMGLFMQFLNVAFIRSWLQRATEVSYWRSFRWTMAHVVPLSLIVVLYILAQQGGSLLLLIPGLVFVIYGHLCVHAFVIEGRAGLSAFKRSAHLVSGSFWGVFGRYLLLLIILGLLILVGGLVAGVAPIIGFIFFLLTMLYTMAVLTAASALVFEGLQAKKPAETFNPSAHSVMVVVTYIFAVLGVAFITIWLWGVQNTVDQMFRPMGQGDGFPPGLQVPD